MRQTNDQQTATEALRTQAGPYRVTLDPEGWPRALLGDVARVIRARRRRSGGQRAYYMARARAARGARLGLA